MFRATLIVRKPGGEIAQIVDLSSLDDANVTAQVNALRARFPVDYKIDESQVEAARAAWRARAA
jgi:hypothetical protein